MKHIVIAEDDPAVGQLLEDVIRERVAASTTVVANGALVADALLDPQPDLLILDVSLPGLSGLDVFDVMQGAPGQHRVPVLFLTGSPERAESATHGARVMAKPFDVDALVGVIADMLGTVAVAA